MKLIQKNKTLLDTSTFIPKSEMQRVFIHDSSWTAKTWSGLASFSSGNVWSDGGHVYYSDGSKQYELNGDTWQAKTWTGLTDFYGERIWSDGGHVYYSKGSSQYELIDGAWQKKTWTGLTSFFGNQVWHDSGHVYYSSESTQYELGVKGESWATKTPYTKGPLSCKTTALLG